jgi:putative colanic acid biosynthesis acetyltransferase WcaF
MGELSALGDGVDCYSMDRITIGSKVAISQRTFLCAGSHDLSLLTRPLVTGPIVIEDHVWIAAESFIHPNVVIGKGTVIGARSVVLKNMPSWSICYGNPCQKIKDRILKANQGAHHA